MRNSLVTYSIWAPDGALWTAWAKPVLFALPPPGGADFAEEIDSRWLLAADYSTMIIVDLPGERGVREGLSLARLGYRPVPLYNGVAGPAGHSLLDVDGIARALFAGADELAQAPLRPDSPPAFLLDSKRMSDAGNKQGKYDNRWCVFPQDMPSAAFLMKNGIKRVIVRTDDDRIASDLAHILCRYQEQGISVSISCGEAGIKPVTVVRPTRFRSWLYRMSVIFGLKRNAAGGFGGMVPEPMQSGSGGRYYGVG